MTHLTLQAGFPSIPLTSGMQIRLEALSPTLDAAVEGVTSSKWMIYGDDLSAGLDALADTIPAYTPLEVDTGPV